MNNAIARYVDETGHEINWEDVVSLEREKHNRENFRNIPHYGKQIQMY